MSWRLAAVAGLTSALLVVCAAWPGGRSELGVRDGCLAYDGLPRDWGSHPLAGMVRIKGGRVVPGTEGGYPDEHPLGVVEVGDFWNDRTEVTRAQFADFVAATGYVTEADRNGGGALFLPPLTPPRDGSPVPWWRLVEGADWRHPEGREGPIATLDAHPVTLVTLADARAYAQWRGNQLPSEAQWEFAARAGDDSRRLGEEPLDGHGNPAANYWQGVFPIQDAGEDGFVGLAPVGCFAANGNGLYDVIGNVWEWTPDAQWGPLISHANGDPSQLRKSLGTSRPHVIKGGAWLCDNSYCSRFRTAARERQEADLATSHLGFRTIRPIVDESPSTE